MTTDTALQRFRLDGRRILVTGASGHLGTPIVQAIAAAGGIAVLAGRTPGRLEASAQALRALGGSCETLAFDVGAPQECRDAIAALCAGNDRLAGIVNCAYGGQAATVETATDADFDLACRQNLAGPFALIQAALPMLRRTAREVAGGASIVNIASMYGHVSPDPRIYGTSGKNNPPFYGAAKAGLLQLTRYLAAHLGPDGIRVNSISPGPFPPPAIAQSAPEFHAQLCAKTPLGRIGDARELAGPALFLLSDAASYVTGADLAVDGGWTAW
ncbi:SDR family oxidoreductase [Piscinibacter sp. XHJ-5]|uniref:SDR family NAD(P)-dependent oxidoreductase n=1 Tax=Piscinibacter sp. XHJ-5 TaxID=3037797 RepID=UPI0024530F42|nr:SDR family oxidoreductase [Piscinibacter sp. XHJ-5]